MCADIVLVWQTLKVAIIDLAGYFSVEYKFHVQFSRTNMKGSKPFHFICNQNKFRLPPGQGTDSAPPPPPCILQDEMMAGQFIVSQLHRLNCNVMEFLPDLTLWSLGNSDGIPPQD